MRRLSFLNTVLYAGALALGAGQAQAGEGAEITLKSLDGSVVLVGELQGFAAGHYNIIVAGLGLVSVEQGLVTCQSSAIDCVALVGNS